MAKLKLLIGFMAAVNLFLFPGFARAGNGKVKMFSEYGQRSTAELIEEEDLDLDYRYARGYFDFRQELNEQFNYKLGYKITEKDYEIDESRDNQLQSFFSSWDWFWLKEPVNIRWRMKGDYKERRYEHKPQNEYDQVKASLNLRLDNPALWQFSWEGGVNDYDYLSAKGKGEFQSYVRVAGKKYFLDKFLTVRGGYKFRNREKNDKADRAEETVKGGFDLKPDLDFIKLIRFQIEDGQRSTLAIEERDDIYDYNYRRWYILNGFKVAERINSSLRYEDLKKDYLAFNHDYTGFLLQNDWRLGLLEDKVKVVALNLAFSRKEIDYPDASALTFNRNRGSIKLSWRRKKQWGLNYGLDLSRYNFPNKKDKNKDVYAGVLDLERKFREQALTMNLRLRHVLKDYVQRSDVKQNTCRLSLKYKF